MAENETESMREAVVGEENNDVQDVEENKGVAMESDDSSSSDGDDGDTETLARIQELQKQVNDSPFMYDQHVALIKALREAGELEGLRNARQRMSEIFPLTEELWLAWLKDEIPLATEDSQRRDLEQLFDRAVKDYVSVPLWLEYVQYAIGGMASADGMKKIRDVFERALTACGLHVTKGANLWEAYREFENAILAGLMPQPGVDISKDLEDKFSAQHDKVSALFKRQLSVPLFDMEETYEEYKDWLQEEPDSYLKQVYKKAQAKLEKIREYEEKLLTAEPPRTEEYEAYLMFEESEKDPARIQTLYERALQENCLTPKLWLQYTKYLDSQLRVDSVVLPVYERAVRNCPWCVQLWQNYILGLERFQQPYSRVKGVFEMALTSGFSQGSEYLLIWTTFLDYLRRRIKWDSDHKEDLETFQLSMETAIQQVDYYKEEGDPNGTLRQFWARIEAKHCGNLAKARELWSEIMVAGQANEAAQWMEYYRFERTYGDNKHCRRILQRALNSVTDWPESIVDAYINFEREEGTLEQYDQAVLRCESQMQRINERREKVAEKEATVQEGRKKGKDDKKQQKQTDFKQRERGGKPSNWKQQKDGNKDTQKPGAKRKVSETTPPSEGDFKMPAPVQSGARSAPPPGFKGEKSAPPPGFKGQRSTLPPGFKAGGSGDAVAESEEPPAKKSKTDVPAHGGEIEHDGSADFRTAFVSNLLFAIDETKLKGFFSKCGEIEEVRLVKNFRGQSKGFAYVQFMEEMSVAKALTYDRTPMEGRPMYVSKCEDRRQRSKEDKFMYPTNLEKNKLFVKNLPFTMSEDALRTMFSQFGELKDVRLVTYRSGKSKGLAYIEYMDEQTAQKALLQADGLQVGEHAISVAISNPPTRKTPLTDKGDTFVPSLGGGKKETLTRGVARTQVMLMPRSLKQKGPQGKPDSATVTKSDSAGSSETQSSDSGSSSARETGMSNADFRSMLLKK